MRDAKYLLQLLLATFLMITTTSSVPATTPSWGGLYPRESIIREVRQLDGIWDFRLAPLQDPNKGFDELWYKQPLKMTGPVIKMAVPSSYNDVTQDKALRDHIGWAWYDRTFYVPKRWIDDKQRIVLRVGSAHYNSIMYLNGQQVATHEGGHLPIMADITDNVLSGKENLLTICMNNTLTPATIPQGSIIHKSDLMNYPPGYFVQKLDFDFFNYAGLHRPIFVYTTPTTYIEDIVIVTNVNGTTASGTSDKREIATLINLGFASGRIAHSDEVQTCHCTLDHSLTWNPNHAPPVAYSISYNITGNSVLGSLKGFSCSIKVYDESDEHVKSAIGCIGQIDIENANLWWPYLMSDNPGYMYKLMVTLSDVRGNIDVYPQKVGIREVGWNSTTVTMNGKRLYLMGCGKHEDANIRGKGVDYALIVKDFSLLKWLGANSFRTSHYPYAEEIMDMADEEGIMVIDESPAVGLNGFGDELLERHISVMKEFVRRDKNRPSVIMWSVGNEPRSSEAAAENYFRQVTSYTRSFDPTRPVTCVLNVWLAGDLAAYSVDVILLNRYYSWYGDTGHLEIITRQAVTDFSEWYFVHRKPVMISEYGAGALAGIHMDPSFTWSEEYQVDLMLEHFKAFDDLKKMGFFFGEMIWNFADFATPQETNRPPGCMKGLFTRERQPKMAARTMRWRFWDLAKSLYNASFPEGISAPKVMGI